LEEFLKDLDLKEVEQTLLAAGADNTDYDEEREVNMIANKKLKGSVMNIALPNDPEEKKRLESAHTGKRKRTEVDGYKLNDNLKETGMSNVIGARGNSSTKDIIRKSFEQHEQNEGLKRIKTSEKGELEKVNIAENGEGEERPYSEATAATKGCRSNNHERDESP